MSDRLKCAGRLNRLLENNFFVAKHYRKCMEAVRDDALVIFFKKKASRRFRFAIELSEEIGFLKGKKCSYGPFSPFRRHPAISANDDLEQLLEKSIRNDRLIYQEYRKALSEINEGSTREILMRHMSYVEDSLRDLRALQAVSEKSKNKTKNQPKTEKL